MRRRSPPPPPIVLTRFSIWIMKPDKHFVAAAGIVIATACLIALTWIGTMRAIHAERADNTARVTATLANQALTFTEQINRQILALRPDPADTRHRVGGQSRRLRPARLARPGGRAERP